jgi:outer membrane protein TolC
MKHSHSLIAAAVVAGALLSGTAQTQSMPPSQQEPRQLINLATGNPAQKTETTAGSQSPTPAATLQKLIHEALRKNPDIHSARANYEARTHRPSQVSAPPDPMVGFNYMGNFIPPFTEQRNDPSSFRQIMVTQDIPYPGKLRLRGEVAGREASAEWWNYETTRRSVIADVKVAYYGLIAVQKAIEITLKDKDLLDRLEKIAEAQYRVGKGIQQDVLRAQVEISAVEQRLEVLRQQEKTAEVRINTLLFRDPEKPLAVAAEFKKASFPYTLDELYEAALKNGPELNREEQMISRNQYALRLANKDYYPDFSVGFAYQQRSSGLPDMYGLAFNVNIPIWYKKKQREGIAEATLDLRSAEKARDNARTSLFFDVKQEYLAAKTSSDLSELYGRALVPQSTLALDSSIASYEVGKVDFLSMLTNFRSILDYEINYYQELSNFQMALARLEVTVGRELTQ